jgi:hypothetical protein
MSVYSLFRFRWGRQWRNGGTRLLLKSLAWGLVAAYVGLFVGWIGLVFPETVAGSEVQRAPVRLLHDHLLSVFAGLLVVRGGLQRFIEWDWRPVLGLPVARSTLVWALQGEAAVSLLNLLPLVGIAALAQSTIAPGASLLGTAFWIAGTLLAVAATHFIHVGLRAAWVRREWGTVLGTSAVVVGLIGGDVYGVTAIRDTSAWLFGGAQRGHPGALLVLLAVTVGTAGASTAALRRYSYDWIEGGAGAEQTRRLSLGVRGWGPLSALVALEGTLILRNRGPREQLLAGGAVMVVLVGLMVTEGIPEFLLGMAPFMLGLLPSVGYGQFAFAWHGGHFDGLLARAAPTKIVRATLIVLGGLAVGPLLLATPVVSWEDPFFALPMAAFALYHAGVTGPVVVWTGVLWNRRRVNPAQSRFGLSGGSVRIIVLMALLSVPPALFAVFGGLNAVFVGVAGLGGLGLGTTSLWLPRLEAVLHHRRHTMLRGFRRGGLSPNEWYW